MSDAEGPTPSEALAICRVCGAGVAPRSLNDHLREGHGLYTYRGVHAGRGDTLDLVLDDLLKAEPSDPAWQALVRLARNERPDDPADAVIDLFVPALIRLRADAQPAVIRGLARLLADDLPLLLTSGLPPGAGRPVAGAIRAPGARAGATCAASGPRANRR